MAQKSPIRARDIDRALTATALDSAYADGQLSYSEHRLRIERASAAVYLEDLRRLAADLQLQVDLPEPEANAAPKPRILLALASVVIVVGGIVVFLATRGGTDDAVALEPNSKPAVVEPVGEVSPAGEDVVPIVARPFVFDTAAGLDDFRARYLDRFSDPTVVQVWIDIDDNRADVFRVTPDGRQERIYVSGGFDPADETEPLDPKVVPFDWTTVDSTVLAGVIAGAPQTVGLAGPDVSTDVTIANRNGAPEISLSLRDPDGNSGYLSVDLTGNPVSVRPYSP